MFIPSNRKEYVNPYRHGTLIGNYVEDMFGQDLLLKYKSSKPYTNYISESMDQYRNPNSIVNKNIKETPNEKLKPDFDFNIDFSKTTMEDIRKQIDLNEKKEKKEKCEGNDLVTNQSHHVIQNLIHVPDQMKNTLQPEISKFIKEDLKGLYFTSQSGIASHLLKGHGKNQSDLSKSEYYSIKGLTIDKKERTDSVLDPHYTLKENFMFPRKFEEKNYQPKPPRYKIYSEFTKSFDKITHNA